MYIHVMCDNRFQIIKGHNFFQYLLQIYACSFFKKSLFLFAWCAFILNYCSKLFIQVCDKECC